MSLELRQLGDRLQEAQELAGDFRFSVQFLDGAVQLLQIDVQDREAVPLFMTLVGVQLLSFAHLFHADEVREGREASLHAFMLEAHVPMPLSSFGKMGEMYVVFGAMAPDSGMDEILLELQILNDNALEARRVLAEYVDIAAPGSHAEAQESYILPE